MKAYVGQTRSAAWIAELSALGFGEMTVREEFPPRRSPWVFDNGAFKDWHSGREFRAEVYQRSIDRLALDGTRRPDFIVAPDIVAAGLASLRFSESWVKRLEWLELPIYLVVQDGMTAPDVVAAMAPYAGLFVGGSLEWKLRTAPEWVSLAHAHDRKCHVGRMGTCPRVRAARRWGVDSIDSALPLWSRKNLERFVRGFSDAPTGDLFEGVA